MSPPLNTPSIWKQLLPRPAVQGHKYDRGHAVVLGAPALTGATRLAASACSRIGAGLVTVAADERGDVYRSSLPADIMVTEPGQVTGRRVTAALVGPGGISAGLDATLDALDETTVVVLDADALTPSLDIGERFPTRILTPHEGEFARAFPDLEGAPEDRARAAARRSDSVVVLKGPNTIIADDDRCLINSHASPYLAKAGSGDVLAGMITGLVAQGMAPLDACAAAVWMHGEAAQLLGAGLIPGDLIDILPRVLHELLD